MDALRNFGFGMENLALPQENVTFGSEIPALELELWPSQQHRASMGKGTETQHEGAWLQGGNCSKPDTRLCHSPQKTMP